MNCIGVPLPNGVLKFNMHVVTFNAHFPNKDLTGLEVIQRTSNDNLINCVAGVIPFQVNQLWVIMVGLKIFFIERAASMI